MVLRWAIRLVLQRTFRWITFGYLRTGHSHDNIDSVFGQLALAIVREVFDTADELVDIVGRLVRSGEYAASAERKKIRREDAAAPAISAGRLVASSYKLDEVAQWGLWGDVVGAKLKGHALKRAPHYFRVCLREDIGLALRDQGHSASRESEVDMSDFPKGVPRSGHDVCIIVKRYLASSAVSQVRHTDSW